MIKQMVRIPTCRKEDRFEPGLREIKNTEFTGVFDMG
jgi:hypothetical protein